MAMFEALGGAAALFYRQTVTLYEPAVTADAFGSHKAARGAALGGLLCNVQPLTSELAQKAYGVTISQGWRLSCAPDARLRLGLLVDFGGRELVVLALLKRKSHFEALIGKG